MGRDSGPGDYRHPVVSRASTEAYRSNWDRTFGGKRKRPSRGKRDLMVEREPSRFEPELAVTAKPKDEIDG